MSEFFQLLIKTNTLNFLIVVGLIAFLLFKLNIKKKLQDVADEIKNYVETAENEKASAQKKLEIINSKVQKLPEVIERIKRSTENSINNYEKKVRSDIEEEKTDLTKNAKRLFKLETKKFKQRLTVLLSEHSIEIARKNAVNQLKDNAELQNHYIDTAIEELDRINL